MSIAGVEGLRLQVEDVLAFARTLSPEEWAAPSACERWRVQDVIAHMGAVFHGVVDPSTMRSAESGLVEEGNDVAVDERRPWGPDQVLEEYEIFAPQALGGLEMFQGEAMAAMTMPLGDLGTYPIGMLADALCFDHLAHLHLDLAVPLGREVEAADADRVAPSIGWMLAGLPQMCRTALDPVLTQPLAIVLTGDGGGTFVLEPATEAGGLATLTAVPEADAPATATSTAWSFLSWGTTRSPWRDDVALSGDEAYGAAVLDAINVI